MPDVAIARPCHIFQVSYQIRSPQVLLQYNINKEEAV
jgi:hypothetical protein